MPPPAPATARRRHAAALHGFACRPDGRREAGYTPELRAAAIPTRSSRTTRCGLTIAAPRRQYSRLRARALPPLLRGVAVPDVVLPTTACGPLSPYRTGG